KESQLIRDAHFLVQPALFRQVADAVLEVGVDAAAKQENGAGIRRGDVDDHADRGRLAGAVWPEQSKHAPRTHVHAEFPDRRELPKTLAHPIQFYGCFVSGHWLSLTNVGFSLPQEPHLIHIYSTSPYNFG